MLLVVITMVRFFVVRLDFWGSGLDKALRNSDMLTLLSIYLYEFIQGYTHPFQSQSRQPEMK